MERRGLNWRVGVVLAVLAAIAFGAVGPQSVGAQETVAASTAEADTLKALEPFLEKARDSGATVIVVDPAVKPAEPPKSMQDQGAVMMERALKARAELRRIVTSSGAFLSRVDEALAAVSPNGMLSWMGWAAIISLLAVAVGLAAGIWVQRWGRGHFAHLYNADPTDRADKLAYLLLRAVFMALAVIVFAVVALLVLVILAPSSEVIRQTGIVVILSVCFVWSTRLVFFNILAPDAPSHRMIAMNDADAWGLYRALIGAFTVGAVTLGVCDWMDRLGLNRDAHKLALIAALTIGATIMAIISVIYRKAVAGAILGGAARAAIAVPKLLLARLWHVIAILYLAFAVAVSSMRLILDMPSASGLVSGPVVVLIGACGVYALALVIVDQLFKRRTDLQAVIIGRRTAQDVPLPQSAEPGEEAEPVRFREPVFKNLIEHGIAILVVAGSAAALLQIWGVDFSTKTNPITRFFDVMLVIFLSYLGYQAVKLWIDAKIAEEEPEEADAAMGEESMGAGGASRLATLLPIFRNFLLITIISMASMIILSQMGVDIGPIFAGAGVVGLAIGFGAQTLVRDIFSGAFFLMDDAFRKGEYIDIGSAKGTVERISIRSFQLRHHNGPLNTVPFGEIQQLTNFSRDWVIMKLPLRVTYDTDVENVRKLIKKLGLRLAEDPEFGPMFMEPLKSQGVLMMDDSAMIIRVKFMCKPGDQFILRRHVFTAIRELFEQEGIKFAHREVTVRIADQDRELSEAEKTAAAAAARSAIESSEAAAPGSSAAEQL